MCHEGTALATQVHAVREQQRRLAHAESVLQISRSIDHASDAERDEVLAAIRQWRERFAAEVATLPPDEQTREQQFLAVLDTALAESAASGA